MQFAFVPGHGSTDAIFNHRQMQEKHYLKWKTMYAVFVDLEKSLSGLAGRWGNSQRKKLYIAYKGINVCYI